MKHYVMALALCAASQPLFAQAAAPVPAVEAKAEDVQSVDGIVAALYNVISGDVGVKRDWDRFRSLYYPGAQMIPTGKDKTGKIRARRSNPDDYIASAPRLEAAGFQEKEIGRRTETFGAITHVFSTYEAKHLVEGKWETMRGINSIQLFHDGKRYWVLNIAWSSETPDNPIPPEYIGVKN
ncbi:hypothetical protein [Allosphingosinicella vermicomposti]|uniref:hypothetical protein n=1 Tax=Allosphingosinicella vermicomposti TaxID=614671 RepID=UPI0018F87812|nr:hypothetical protein [Allosphingosinicella vermicomposti]